jgi:hypothetical protein
MLRDLRLWRCGLLAALDVVVDSYWFPAYGHPDGASPVPWFRVVDGWGYRTEHNPAGESQSPSFRLVDEWAYPTLALPGTQPTFQVVGAFVYAEHGAPWFQTRQRAS